MPERELDLESGTTLEVDPKVSGEAEANLIIWRPGDGGDEELRLSSSDVDWLIRALEARA